MKRVIILLSILFFACGCSAKYKLEIMDSDYKEQIKITEKDSSLFNYKLSNGMTIEESFDALGKSDVVSDFPYRVNIKKNSRKIIAKIDKSLNNIYEISSVLQCYDSFNIRDLEDKIGLESGEDFTCFSKYEILDSIKVVIKTNHKVFSNNADFSFGNYYVWKITKDSIPNIKLIFYKDEIKSNIYTKLILFSIIILVFIIISFIVKNKISRKNI